VDRRSRREDGSVILIALILAIVLSVSIAAALIRSRAEASSAQFTLESVAAQSLAESVGELAQREIINALANFTPPPESGSVTLGGATWTFTSSVVGEKFAWIAADGLELSVQPYRINVEIDMPRTVGRVELHVFVAEAPAYQYMVLYDDDLEIIPGPNMILGAPDGEPGGRMHTNGTAWVGTNSTLTLNTDHFKSCEDIFKRSKATGATSTGTVRPKVLGSASFQNLVGSFDSAYSGWLDYSRDRWNGAVESGAHGVRQVAVLDLATIAAFDPGGSKGYYHEKADLVIVDDKAYDTDDSEITLPAGCLTEQSLYDAREGKTVTVSVIDMALLVGSGSYPANGILYAYRTDATSTQPNGILLRSGQQLGGPLTVVSAHPVYIQGDYNSVDWTPAAVIADAVNFLSNAWNNSKFAGSPAPLASDTEYRLAMITGNVPTPDGGGQDSGGLHNLPRFHENWSGITMRFTGSFLNLFASEIARGSWKVGTLYYQAPVRDWRFETNFFDPSLLPPETPRAVFVERVIYDDLVSTPVAAAAAP
jgi:hypothetical protein